jgi:hypothetical protein
LVDVLVHGPVIDSKTQASPPGFWMHKCVYLLIEETQFVEVFVNFTGNVTSLTSSTESPATSLTMSQKSLSCKGSFSAVQKLTSLKHGGYFEYDLKVVIFPAGNWERKRESDDQNNRISGMEKRIIAMRSNPKPKAQPILSGTSKKGL